MVKRKAGEAPWNGQARNSENPCFHKSNVNKNSQN